MPEKIKNALLIYNPTSGRRRHRRFSDVERAANILANAGILTELVPTTARFSATAIARQAVEQRSDLVIACGGDGTVNEVVNGLAGSQVPMALPLDGHGEYSGERIGRAVGHSGSSTTDSRRDGAPHRAGTRADTNGPYSDSLPPDGRYFLCVAGAGPDGAIVNGVDETLKKKAGILAYWSEGARQFFSYTFPEMKIFSGACERRATFVVLGRTAHYGAPQDHHGREPV